MYRANIFHEKKHPTAICWSSDASLLCAAFGANIVVYCSVYNKIVDVMSCGETLDEIVSLQFLGATGRHLVVADCYNIVLWDLTRRSGNFYSSNKLSHH